MRNQCIGGRQHQWNVSTQQARAIQAKLRELWEGKDRLGTIRTIAGLDASFVVTGSQAIRQSTGPWSALRAANLAIGCVVVYELPELREVAHEFAVVPLAFPYVPGLLSFREIPALLAALSKLKVMPDLLFCDGQGIAHPRRLGLASHLGVLLDRPAIGCAKSILIGTHRALSQKAGSWAPLIDEKTGGETIGAAVRTRDRVQPVYVSQGNRISLETAVRLTVQVSDGFRIPRPTREADHLSKEVKRNIVAGKAI